MTEQATCSICGEDYNPRRAALGYTTCLDCGESDARNERKQWAICPLPKQGYTRITKKEELQWLNQKPR